MPYTVGPGPRHADDRSSRCRSLVGPCALPPPKTMRRWPEGSSVAGVAGAGGGDVAVLGGLTDHSEGGPGRARTGR